MIHRSRNGPAALSGGSIPLGRRDIEAFPFPDRLADPAAVVDRRRLEAILASPDAPFPDDPGILLAGLDLAFETLTRNPSESMDRFVQRAVLTLAGVDSGDTETILAAWYKLNPSQNPRPQAE